LWRSPQHWRAIVIAAATAAVLTAPLALLYISFQQATGFQRTLADARGFAADWRAYLASSAYLHKWMLPLLGHWAEVLFPGFTMTIFGAVGAIAGYRSGARGRELALLYGALAGLAFWTSLGPAGGLYSAL